MMLSLWERLPVILRAIASGTVLAAMGTIPWALLAAANFKFLPSVPWSALAAALYMWLFWRYAGGAGWPRATAEARRRNRRANQLSGEVWGAALGAGILGIATLVLLLRVLSRMIRLPQEQVPDISRVPLVTLFFMLLVGSAVAGIVEEVSYRGYMQAPIERRHGPVVAILVTGVLFGFAHFTHPEVTLALMPYYLAAAAIYGALAYLTNSILPSLVLHAGGNFLAGIGLLARGHREWQGSPTPAPSIWQAGADASLWITCVATVIAGGIALWAYAALGRLAWKPSAA
jgi:membrane protease YdiL (CAAX protease family)